MTESADGASPVMGAPAGLHSNDAARAPGQKSQDFIARKRLAERHAAVSAGTMRLKAPLCKVETDDANFFHGCPLHSWDAQTSPPWHIAMPSGGGIHSINQTLPRWLLTPHLHEHMIKDIIKYKDRQGSEARDFGAGQRAAEFRGRSRWKMLSSGKMPPRPALLARGVGQGFRSGCQRSAGSR